MAWTDNLLARVGLVSASVLGRRIDDAVKAAESRYPEWLLASAQSERFHVQSAATADKQLDLYQKLTWIQIAISHVGNAVATTKFSVKQLEGEDESDIANHPFETALLRPNPLQSRFEFLKATAAFFAATGNAYWWMNRPSENAVPLEYWVVPSNRIRPVPDGKLFISGYEYLPRGGAGGDAPIMLPTWSICHFKEFNPASPFIGLSPLVSLNVVAQGDLAMQSWNTNYFGKDNAKVPGALAFADPIGEEAWETLKDDMKKQWGGTNRGGPLLLRNAGAGGVQWLSMGFNQKEMEFISSRQFNKEEIFAVFAPGLASIIDTNATQANAISGKATFTELAVWPKLVMLAEKITNDVLPLYGENLRGEFDDIRVTDRVLLIQEQAAYEKSHTVAEVRREYYGDDPLGDERDDKFISEVGAASVRETAQAPSADLGLDAPGAQQQPMSDMAQPGKVTADLVRWERKAVKAIENGKRPEVVRFVSDAISAEEYRRIEDGLKVAETADDVARLFTQARRRSAQVEALPAKTGTRFQGIYP